MGSSSSSLPLKGALKLPEFLEVRLYRLYHEGKMSLEDVLLLLYGEKPKVWDSNSPTVPAGPVSIPPLTRKESQDVREHVEEVQVQLHGPGDGIVEGPDHPAGIMEDESREDQDTYRGKRQ